MESLTEELDTEEIYSIWGKLNRFYNRRIYSHNRDVRGATFLARNLKKKAMADLPKVKTEQMSTIEDLDWENLVILDGCRYDTYKIANGPEVDFRYSSGSGSPSFIYENFREKEFKDTVLISGNPFTEHSRFRKITRKEPENIFHEFFPTIENRWDSERGTIHPKSIIKDLKTAEKLFPEKRKIVWFMQPHIPFLSWDKGSGFTLSGESRSGATAWNMAKDGDISRGELIEGFIGNIDFVMDYVEKLENIISGKTIITADHGTLLGENGSYGHRTSLPVLPLRKVPVDKRKL